MIIYSHSNLYYWWPVWAFGFVFALWTYLEQNRMLIVPASTEITRTGENEWTAVIPFRGSVPVEEQEKYIFRETAEGPEADRRVPKLNVSRQAWMGPIYFLVILLTIVITNVPLRGLWSVIVIIALITIAVLFALLDVWDWIFETAGNLHVYVNMGGYLFLSTVVFLVWALATFFFDKRTYIVFTPGQVRVREEIGGREKTYDTIGMTSEKHRDDVFRHLVLGFGSGDLTVRPSGERQPIILPNVLFIGSKLSRAQSMLARRNVGTTHPV